MVTRKNESDKTTSAQTTSAQTTPDKATPDAEKPGKKSSAGASKVATAGSKRNSSKRASQPSAVEAQQAERSNESPRNKTTEAQEVAGAQPKTGRKGASRSTPKSELSESSSKKTSRSRSKGASAVVTESVTTATNDAPRSPLSLIFQAPDLPTPTIDPKRGVPIVGQTDEAHLRRRVRRRPGEDVETENAPANTVVKVRTPRPAKEPIDEPQRIKGSTRLEAKKQRRRDGRDTGRRRSVITESEFLARREAVDRTMVVRSKDGKIQIGVLEDGILVEHYVAKAQEASLIGNVYLGKVQNVLPSMEAAFVDIGRGRNAVLYSGEVDWELAETGSQPRRIELALKSGDPVLVQVTKDPIGQKGARLTSQVSLPGRYLVYVPNGNMNGISRKLPESERTRLKRILKDVLPEDAGVIVRTAAEGATEDQLTLDVQRLQTQWDSISKKVEKSQAPVLLHSEPDLLIKIVRDVFNEDFQKMIISGDDARGTIEEYLQSVAPDLLERVENYTDSTDVFEKYRVSEQIAKALDRKVFLPSGGSLVIDRTEAMTVVDVNTGKFVGSGGNLEETVTKNNLEAAEEIVRQLRLRDIGGIIVVDFIDMVLESNRDLVLRRLMECLSRDRTKHQVAEVTSLGLVQMTRKKLGLGLLEAFSEPCEACAARGVIVHHEPIMKQRPSGVETFKTEKQERRRDRDKRAKPEVAKVVTPELAVEINSALAKIAASTMAAHEAAGEPSPITLPMPKISLPADEITPELRAENEKKLDAVLESLPEGKTSAAPSSNRRKPRRASSVDRSEQVSS